MNKSILVSGVLAFFLLSGCVSPEQAQLMREIRENQAEQERVAYRERLFASCDNMGFQRTTPQHAQCVLSLHQQNMGIIGAAALMQMQQQPQETNLQRAQREQRERQRALTPRPPTYTNCTRDGMGNLSCVTR